MLHQNSKLYKCLDQSYGGKAGFRPLYDLDQLVWYVV